MQLFIPVWGFPLITDALVIYSINYTKYCVSLNVLHFLNLLPNPCTIIFSIYLPLNLYPRRYQFGIINSTSSTFFTETHISFFKISFA